MNRRQYTEQPDAVRRSTARIAVIQGAEPEDWRATYDRLNQASKRLSRILVKGAAATASFGGMLSAALVLGLGLHQLFPGAAAYHLAAAVILPSALCGAAAGQAAGNLFLRFWYDLDDVSRRGFATRLSLANAPRDWPAHLRRWLFTGDWLGSPTYDLHLPYVRIFITGEAPATCGQEDALWREIHECISGDSLWEAGANVRQISYPATLPEWARRVENGDGFGELCARIGHRAATEWVGHLWRRACRHWPVLEACDNPMEAARECFEMHSLALADGRDALIVVLRPAAFVSGLTDTALTEESLAA